MPSVVDHILSFRLAKRTREIVSKLTLLSKGINIPLLRKDRKDGDLRSRKRSFLERKRLLKSARAGDGEAQYQLGRLYASGDGVLQNGADAKLWYRRAAEQGHCQAQYQLSLIYFNGHRANGSGVEQWYRAAARSDKTAADDNLGLLFPNGTAVAQDFSEALRPAHDPAFSNVEPSVSTPRRRTRLLQQPGSSDLILRPVIKILSRRLSAGTLFHQIRKEQKAQQIRGRLINDRRCRGTRERALILPWTASRQRSIAAADQKGGLVRPILRRVAAAMKPIETTAREAN
jgi:Sel1 repeat